MNYKNVFSALSVVALLFLSACSKKAPSAEEAAQRIVAFDEPAVLMSMEIKSMLDKGGITSKENIPMIAQMLFSDKVEYFSNPEKIGLDLTGKSFVGVSGNDKGASGWAITKIKDKEKFEKMLKDEGNDKFEEIEGYNAIIEKDEMIIAWNESTLILLGGQEKDIKGKFKKYAEAIKEDKKPSAAYAKFFEVKADGAVLTNFSKFAEIQKNMPRELRGNEKEMEMLSKVTNKMKGSFSMFSMSFENDKIVADITNTFSDGLKKEMDFFSKDGLPKEMLAQIGSNDLTGFVSMNGDVKRYLEWLTNIMGEDDIFAQAQRETGFDVMRILKSLKGNVMFAVLGFMTKEYNYGVNEDGTENKFEVNLPQISLVASLNDNYLETLADSVLKDKKKGNYFVTGSEYNPQFIAFKPGYITYTNDENLFIAPVANANPTLDADAQKAMAKPLSFYFDLNKLISKTDKGEVAQKIASKFKHTYGGMDMDGGHAELILNNGGKNSLWTLINLTVESTADMATSFK